jgi:hypothetical protein
MMKKWRNFGLLIVFLVACAFVIGDSVVYAKSSGSSGGGGGRSSGGYSGGSSRSSFSSSPSYSSSPSAKSSSGWAGKQSASIQSTQAPQKSVSGYGGKQTAQGNENTSQPAAKSATPSRDAAAIAKTESISKEQSRKAMADYNAQQAKFKYSGSPVKISTESQRAVTNRVTVNNYHYDSGAYAYRSGAFYGGYGWAPPAYGYGFYPSYGLWNTVALWFMLDHIHDQAYSMMYYSHRNDVDMQTWRNQVEHEADNNAELKAKLTAMDQRMQAMEKQGVKQDPGYVPPEMKEVALSEDVLKSAEPQPIATPAVYKSSVSETSKSYAFLFLAFAIVGSILGYLLFVRKY